MLRKRLLAIVLALLAFSLFAAAAATLGGLSSADLGADATQVMSCDSDGVSVDYTAEFDATDSRFEVTEVIVSGIHDDCAGQTLSVALGDGAQELDSGSVVVAGNTATVTGLTADAEAVTQIAVVIAG